jgi:hypothetical protein
MFAVSPSIGAEDIVSGRCEPASGSDREAVGWVKARQRSGASSPEHRGPSGPRPRSDGSLVASGSGTRTEQGGLDE